MDTLIKIASRQEGQTMRVRIARQINGTYSVSFYILNRWVNRAWNGFASYEIACNTVTDLFPTAEIETYRSK